MARLPTRGDGVVDAGDTISQHVPDDERVAEADEAAHEADSIADEELAQETQVRANDGAPLDDEPVRRDEERKPADEACGETIDTSAQTKGAGPDQALEPFRAWRLRIGRQDYNLRSNPARAAAPDAPRGDAPPPCSRTL